MKIAKNMALFAIGTHLLYDVWRLVFGIHLYPIARLEMAFWPDDDGPDQEPEPHPEEP